MVAIGSWESFWRMLDGDRWWYFFYFLTSWASLFATAYFALVGFRSAHKSGFLCSSWWAGVLWHATTTMSLLATVVYWGAIFSTDRYMYRKDGLGPLLMGVSIHLHGVALALLLIDVGLTVNTSLSVTNSYHWNEGLGFTLGVGLVYQTVLVGVYLTEGFWVYAFMNPQRPLANFLTYTTLAICCWVVHLVKS